MAYKSLQHFIELLEKEGELLRVNSYVNPELDITEITDRISKQPGGGKALLFEDTGTEFPVLINSLGSERRIAMALGLGSLDEAGERILQLLNKFASPKNSIWQKLSMLPSLREIASWMPVNIKGNGECQQTINLIPNLKSLPILKCWPNDGGCFITLPLVHTIDPFSGMRNVGMYRMQVFSETTTGMHWHRHKTGARHYAGYKKLGKQMPIAVALGGDPVYTYAATAPLPDNIDEYVFAGFLRQKRVKLVRCITQDIYVPADADIIIEGYIDTAENLIWEGPFGDHTGFYSLADWYPVFHVTCITHKKGAIYPATLVGIPPQEDAYIAKATERIFLSPIKMAMAPEMLDMNLPIEGVAHNLAVLKIEKSFPGQAFKVMNSLWGAGQMMFNKVLIVCDNGTDIFDPKQVLQACIDNISAPSHMCFQMGPADVLDHSAQSFTYGGKVCFDATKKMPEELLVKTIGEKIQQIDINALKLALKEIKGLNDNNIEMAEKGILFLSIKNNAKNEWKSIAETILRKFSAGNTHAIIFYDEDVLLTDISFLVWMALGNIDPVRDIKVESTSGQMALIINACSKHKEDGDFDREWPEIIASSVETILKVDKEWENLKIGPKLLSPSLKLRRILGTS